MATPIGLTRTTTRKEYLAQCANSYAQSAPYGGNTAVLDHVVKLHNMADDEWPAHRAELLRRAPERAAAARQMVDQLMGRPL